MNNASSMYINIYKLKSLNNAFRLLTLEKIMQSAL